MTEPPKKSRRWLWIVLAIAMVFGGGLGWWFWPRGDVRFVGRWAFYEKVAGAPVGEVVLQRHGMGQFNVAGQPISISFRWEVAEGRLILGSTAEGSINKWREQAADLFMEWTGHTFLPTQEKYRFEILNPDEIRLSGETSPPDDVVLRRLVTR